MHSQNIVHCDLKPENILVDENYNLKIADFGLAVNKNIGGISGKRGTRVYWAPEICSGKTYNGLKIDIFSLGVILFVMVVGTFPFKNAVQDEYYYQHIYNGDNQKYWEALGLNNLSDNFKDLFLKMVSYDPSERPSIDEIFAHPWMNDISYDKEQAKIELITKFIAKTQP